jgi:3D (Asp-Asp-Asp) domain-containing protein
MRRLFALLLIATLWTGTAVAKKRPTVLTVFATAHSVEGETAAGTVSRVGTAAADPRILPLGSKIRVLGAGKYSGDYSVEDTGPAVKGREIDIYMKTGAEAKKFGRQKVKVIVLKYGDGEVAGAPTAGAR